jgi:hypothetical protein
METSIIYAAASFILQGRILVLSSIPSKALLEIYE